MLAGKTMHNFCILWMMYSLGKTIHQGISLSVKSVMIFVNQGLILRLILGLLTRVYLLIEYIL